jgi:GNAT superfamily N-acetyltransferase
MATPVTVRKVENKSDFKAFFEFPWRVYKNDPNWVPPLLSMRKELLDKKKNPSWEYMEGDYYVAWRGDNPVGTIAAFVNRHHNEFHEENISWFGFFEVYDDQEAATALLEAAAEWGRSRGYDGVRGPQSFTIMDEVGLLVENFDRPVVMMPYNPPYYQALVENSGVGFAKVMDVHCFYMNWELLGETRIAERLENIVKRMQRNQSIEIRAIDRKNLKQEFQLFKDIYNSAWEKNWGFTPFTPAELDMLVHTLGQFFDPDMACFAYVDGKPAAFAIGIPDLNQAVQKAYPRPGVPEWVTLIKALWHWKIRSKIDWLRLPLLGVKEEYRNKGIDLAMYHFLFQAILKNGDRYQHLDSGWVLETNHPMMKTGQKLGMKQYRTHRFYEKPLDP